MNLSVVIITHQMEVVRDACSEVAVLDKGKVVELGSVERIFSHPQSEVSKDFLAHLSPNTKINADIVRWSNEGGKYTLRFEGVKTGEPILSQISRECNVDFNIRAGGIQQLQNTSIGTLITDISGSADSVVRAIQSLKAKGVIVEVE